MERIANVAPALRTRRAIAIRARSISTRRPTIRYRSRRSTAKTCSPDSPASADFAFAAGAIRVMTLHTVPLGIERSANGIAASSSRVRRSTARIGIAPNRQILFSRASDGYGRDGKRSERSVVDPTREGMGIRELLVADASIFPQSSGVNPMLTIMAMANRIADATSLKLAVYGVGVGVAARARRRRCAVRRRASDLRHGRCARPSSIRHCGLRARYGLLRTEHRDCAESARHVVDDQGWMRPIDDRRRDRARNPRQSLRGRSC